MIGHAPTTTENILQIWRRMIHLEQDMERKNARLEEECKIRGRM
jgi:hypothetical protein